MPLLLLLFIRVNDNDDNDVATSTAAMCCASIPSLFGIVSDTINSFIVPLLWLLFVKLVLFSIVVAKLPLFPLILLLAMTPKFHQQAGEHEWERKRKRRNRKHIY